MIMQGYKFMPPIKFKTLYLIINILIIISLIIGMIFFDGLIEKSIPLCIFCLFNGFWSLNRKWYSFFHRNNKEYSNVGVWLIFIIIGTLLLVLDVLYYVV